MRKVVLNMTMTFDGFFAGPHGELDWMVQTPDQELNDDIVAFFQGIDRGFIGYPTASGMIPYWLNVAKNPSASKGERGLPCTDEETKRDITSRAAEMEAAAVCARSMEGSALAGLLLAQAATMSLTAW